MSSTAKPFTAGDLRRLLAGVPDSAELQFGAGDLVPRAVVDESPLIGPLLYRIEFKQLYAVLAKPGA